MNGVCSRMVARVVLMLFDLLPWYRPTNGILITFTIQYILNVDKRVAKTLAK